MCVCFLKIILCEGSFLKKDFRRFITRAAQPAKRDFERCVTRIIYLTFMACSIENVVVAMKWSFISFA